MKYNVQYVVTIEKAPGPLEEQAGNYSHPTEYFEEVVQLFEDGQMSLGELFDTLGDSSFDVRLHLAKVDEVPEDQQPEQEADASGE